MPQVDSTLLNRFTKDHFSGDHFSDELLDLIQMAPLPGLDAEPRCKETAKRIESYLTSSPALRGSLTEAALWLLAGELDRSHEVSQGWETAEGSYWHGIMHRREGDFWNAKYWFRKVGKHPVFEQLANSARTGFPFLSNPELSDPTKVSSALVDNCERALSSQSEQVDALQRICWLEWQFLFLYSCD